MSIRTTATILREIQQARTAPIAQHIKDLITKELQSELEQIYSERAKQSFIDFNRPADPPGPPGAGGSNSPAPKGKG